MNFDKTIINLSFGGWSANQTLYMFDSGIVDKKLKGKELKKTYLIFIPDWTNRTLGLYNWSRHAPFYIRGDEGFVFSGKRLNEVFLYKAIEAFNFSSLFRSIYYRLIGSDTLKNKKQKYLVEYIVEFNKKIKTKYKSDLIVIVWGRKEAEYEFEKLLKEKGIKIIRKSTVFDKYTDRYSIKYDGHPSAWATKKMADYLYKITVQENKPLDN